MKLTLSQRLVMLTCGVPSTMTYAAIAPILPKMAAELSHGPADQLLIKMVMAIPGMAIVVGTPLAGMLSDKIGRAPLIFWGMLAWAVCGVLGYFVSDLHVMLGSRVLVGLAASIALTGGLAMIGDLPDAPLRDRFMGWQAAVSTVVNITILPVAGLLGDVDWRLPFGLFLLSLPLAAVSYFCFRGNWNWRAQESRQPQINQTSIQLPIGLMVVAFLIGAVTFVSVTYMPFVLQMMGLNTATTIGMALTVQSVATAVAAGIFGPLRRYASYNMTCFLCFLAGAVGLAVCSTAATFPASIVGLLLLGLCMGWAPPNFVSRAAEIARPETRGRIVGVMKGMYFSASLLAVLALEPVVRSQGPKGALIAIMIVCLVAAAVFLPLALPSLRRSRRA